MSSESPVNVNQPKSLLWNEILVPSRAHISRQWSEYRLLTGLSLLFLAIGGPLLWFWDRILDPAGAAQTLWLRLAFAFSAIVGWWQYRQSYKKWTPWVLLAWMLTLQGLFLAILVRLDGGLGLGVSGLLFWTMAGMVMFQGCSIWVNFSYTLLVFLIPLFAAFLGWLPGFNKDAYGLVVFPATLVAAVVQLVNSWNFLMRYHAECRLEVLSKTDPLTGLLNRRAFYEAFDALLSDHRRASLYLALIYFDSDRFKSINDTYGHSSGDAVLVNLAVTCQSICRRDDLLARMGGEEFVIAFKVDGSEQASIIAERLRKTVEDSIVESEGHRIQYTISIGLLVEDRNRIDSRELLKLADEAMYQAKEGGRNRVVMAPG